MSESEEENELEGNVDSCIVKSGKKHCKTTSYEKL